MKSSNGPTRTAWASAPAGLAASPPEEWEATRAQTALATQVMRSEDDYLAPERHDIGRLTAENERELFVSCDPAQAMQQQFEHLRPEFIAVHDIATSSSGRLLTGVAAASSRPVQTLAIRRQGYGNVLARLRFVELPTTDGSSLRMYSTEADAELAARPGLARMLLAFSRLGVVMVGSLPAPALGTALKPLDDAMADGPWLNRQLLLLPLGAGSALAELGGELGRHLGVTVRTTPQVTRAADAWGFINSSWSRAREAGSSPAARSRPAAASVASQAVAMPQVVGLQQAISASPAAAAFPEPRRALSPGPTPQPMRPMPEVGGAPLRAGAPRNLLEHYVHRLSELAGVVSCCVFDVSSGLETAHAGASPGAADLAMHGKALLAGLGASARALGLGHALPEAAITLGAHHLLLRAVPGHPGLALHAVLDKTTANLTLARLQVQRLDALLDPSARP